ncbi:MAG: cupin domain-containing protein [Candidatus Rokubacteria bacterium]|nr:cupin domain-containing protein [Candidatus Rokubacteria bacterium]
MPAITGFDALTNLPEEKISPQISRRVLSGAQGMVVWWSMKQGAHAAAHRHPNEQLFWVTSGSMDIRIGAERRVCKAGDCGVIPGGVEHEAWFPSDCEVIDVFAPRREDFLTADAPVYMRKG